MKLITLCAVSALWVASVPVTESVGDAAQFVRAYRALTPAQRATYYLGQTIFYRYSQVVRFDGSFVYPEDPEWNMVRRYQHICNISGMESLKKNYIRNGVEFIYNQVACMNVSLRHDSRGLDPLRVQMGPIPVSFLI